MAKGNSLDKLLERKAKLDTRIQAIKSRETAQARKDDTRRKVLVGSLVLNAVKMNENQRLWLDSILDNGLKRDDERALFNMPPLAAPAAAPEKAPEFLPPPTAPAPVNFPVCLYQSPKGHGAWVVDYLDASSKGHPSQDHALQSATMAVSAAWLRGDKRKPSDEATAKSKFNLDVASAFPDQKLECKIEWVEVG